MIVVANASPQGQHPKEQPEPMKIISKYSVFGEAAVIDRTLQPYAAVAVTDVTCYRVHWADYVSILMPV
eukprot:SAG31_NODE_15530_length_750_cov_1.066052_1_plen_69_part_00